MHLPSLFVSYKKRGHSVIFIYHSGTNFPRKDRQLSLDIPSVR